MAESTQYDLIIIGSGPGGYVAAVRAAELGLRTACVERWPRLGGVCLNIGCIPSKALLDSSEQFDLARNHFAEHGITTGEVGLNLEAMMTRKAQVVETLTSQVSTLLHNHDVEIMQGTARLVASDRVEVTPTAKSSADAPLTLQANAILLATGSEPISVTGLAFDGEHIVSSTEALAFETVPEHLVIVGGGYIGLELGSVWKRLGANVTVVEMLPTIAATLDRQVGRTLQRMLAKQGLEFHLNTKVSTAQVTGDTVQVTLESDGQESTLECDKLLVAVGRSPLTRNLGLEEVGVTLDPRTKHVLIDERYCTNIPTIYAIGDIVPGPMLAHKASAEARAAVECIAGLPGEVNYDAIPAIVYTWPEVASVGLTEEQLKEREIPYRTGNFPFAGVGRARCMGEKEGFVKLLAHAKTDRLLGVHIIGPRASEMIAEGVLAMEFGASSEDLARTIHGHPTLAEGVQEAAWAMQKK
ncbi:dihydrolipoyl dehydrogenase [candidate division KSB3 bacterium]|uniref:Dihydrolipoyl dehydrogenase n=1 Tax=candidate division KSB3 bacterium TaxID=2044937 RepID=A0A9D5JYP7_9BACT|nr:dihydrolipoyl dehydrogenase [candidate division KSB3 bacterium]MBD3326242.1 dihydrolipoyl dehydrogenase [candidate division KSB3 bacterium]